MYKDRTQNYDPEIHEEYPINDNYFLCHIIILYLDYSIATNTTSYTERKQFSAVTVSLKSVFFCSKKYKNLGF